MKKLLILFSILTLTLCCVGASAQTYTYRYLYSVDTQTGVKSKSYGENYKIHITFTNNMRFCYMSDKNGVKESDMISRGEGYNEYHYTSGSNGIHSYKCTETYYAIYFGRKVPVGEPSVTYLNFSTDYERLNNIIGKYANVFERSDNKQSEVPNQLW